MNTDLRSDRLTAEEEMMRKWNAWHDTLGGPVDDDDIKAMHKARDAFLYAANDYCAILSQGKNG